MNIKLSDNFYLNEFTKSDTAVRLGIDNTPTTHHLVNLKVLINKVLQPLRILLDEVITVNSGYRSELLNTAVHGSKTSAHCRGEAADIECHSMSNHDLAKLITEQYGFDQVILEFYSESDPHAGWVHVSYVNERLNRKQILIARKNSNNKIYYEEVTSL